MPLSSLLDGVDIFVVVITSLSIIFWCVRCLKSFQAGNFNILGLDRDKERNDPPFVPLQPLFSKVISSNNAERQ